MRDRTKRKITVEIDNLTEAQVIALSDLFATWMQLGSWGSSRDTTFFADGDGDFRPKITVNGEKPGFTTLIDRKRLWVGDNYRIDYDSIGWALSAIDEKEISCTKEAPDRAKEHHDFPRDRSAETPCGNGCGLLWKETPYYHPPVDYKVTPHQCIFAEGGTACDRCGNPRKHELHVEPSAQLQQAEASR